MTGIRRNREQGAALVELPLVVIAFTVLALCFTALGQLFLDYHHLSGVARAAARYATKADYDPTQAPSTRRPGDAAVKAFAAQAASPLPASEIAVALTPDTAAGNGVDVVVTHPETSGAFGLLTGSANRVLGLLGARLPTLTLSAHATAIYE
jgi:Flp pilus assembly protein TadG